MNDTTRTPSLYLATALLAAAAALPPVAADTPAGLAAVMPTYQTIHLALVADSTEGIAAAAAELAGHLEKLAEGLTAESAGVSAEQLAEVVELLPEAASAARQLAGAGSIEDAREAFYALSKPLVRWRQVAGSGPAVVYCPMAKKSWLQPAGEPVGNPYYGQMMARCGEILES